MSKEEKEKNRKIEADRRSKLFQKLSLGLDALKKLHNKLNFSLNHHGEENKEDMKEWYEEEEKDEMIKEPPKKMPKIMSELEYDSQSSSDSEESKGDISSKEEKDDSLPKEKEKVEEPKPKLNPLFKVIPPSIELKNSTTSKEDFRFNKSDPNTSIIQQRNTSVRKSKRILNSKMPSKKNAEHPKFSDKKSKESPPRFKAIFKIRPSNNDSKIINEDKSKLPSGNNL